MDIDTCACTCTCSSVCVCAGFLSIITLYALMNKPMKYEESIVFYQTIQESVVWQVVRCDMLLIMGDFNARVGNDAAAWQGYHWLVWTSRAR